MKWLPPHQTVLGKLLSSSLLLFSLASPTLQAQLAVTEVMAWANFFEENPFAQGADFWELTNFGHETIALKDYRFIDQAGVAGADPSLLSGLSIAPQESMIFFRAVQGLIETPEAFKAWWGASRLPTNLQVVMYRVPGFDNIYDEINLWKLEGNEFIRIQHVPLANSRLGHTFTYSPETGEFDRFSDLGQPRCFPAERRGDVGSPGFTRGPVRLNILEHPHSAVTCLGLKVELEVRVTGLPAPRCFWFHDGNLIPGAREPKLTLTSFTESDRGRYWVEVDNGLERIRSETAILAFSEAPQSPTLIAFPNDLELTDGQMARFSVRSCANPPATYQWYHDGIPLPTGTGPDFEIAHVDDFSPGIYRVEVSNPLGIAKAEARLTISPKPLLYVTEVMAMASTNGVIRGHADWWELTNFGSEPVKLQGYHWDDSPGVLDLSVLISDPVVIKPMESIILTEQMTRAEFIRWWGAKNLPAGLQVLTYHGNGFGNEYDSVTVWNATATEDYDRICSVDFSNPPSGVSLWFDPQLAPFGEPSVEGVRGAFRAAESDDVGSPGWIDDHSPPLFIEARSTPTGLLLSWPTEPQGVYEVLAAVSLSATVWESVLQRRATTPSMSTLIAPGPGTDRFRFFKVIRLNP